MFKSWLLFIFGLVPRWEFSIARRGFSSELLAALTKLSLREEDSFELDKGWRGLRAAPDLGKPFWSGFGGAWERRFAITPRKKVATLLDLEQTATIVTVSETLSEHFSILPPKGFGSHRLAEAIDGRGILLSSLEGFEIGDSDLRGITLSGGVSRVEFVNSNLSQASAVGGPVRDVTFFRCSMEQFSIGRARISDVRVLGCNLDGATFAGSVIDDLTLSGCVARDASFAGVLGDVRQVGVTLSIGDSDLTGASLRGARVPAASFNRVTLAGADFTDAKFMTLVLKDVDAHGILLRGADLGDASFGSASFSSGDFSGANLGRVKLLTDSDTFVRAIGDVAWSDETIWPSQELTDRIRATSIEQEPGHFRVLDQGLHAYSWN